MGCDEMRERNESPFASGSTDSQKITRPFLKKKKKTKDKKTHKNLKATSELETMKSDQESCEHTEVESFLDWRSELHS